MNTESALSLLNLATFLFDDKSTFASYDRFLKQLKLFTHFDSAAILIKEGNYLEVVSSLGLKESNHKLKFFIEDQPRLNTIINSKLTVRFPADSTLKDPFDNHIKGIQPKDLKVHSCLGCPLIVDDIVVGCLTIDALKPGAFDHFSEDFLKTLGNLLGASLRTALLLQKLQRDNSRHKEWFKELRDYRKNHEKFIGNSSVMIQLKRELNLIAKTPFPALVLGETGTGKEMIARMIHDNSDRNQGPWIPINCAALPESIAESELFGHIKGAFTGASNERIGKFELAHEGTLFLDEIGDLSLNLQAKILRVLQEGEVQKLGSDNYVKVDVRIVAATHMSLEEMVKKGSFRKDLWHRLHVFPLRVPPLRERIDDIKDLVEYFAQEVSQELKLPIPSDILSSLESWQGEKWEGNIRELKNRVRVAFLGFNSSELKENKTKDSDFKNNTYYEGYDDSISHKMDQLNIAEAVDLYKKIRLENEIHKARGNMTKVAQSLGVDRGNLYRLVKRLDVQIGGF